MHDTVWFEINGIPAVTVASEEFKDAAAKQSAALGMDASCCFVKHPIQDRSDDEMRQLADDVFPDILAALINTNR